MNEVCQRIEERYLSESREELLTDPLVRTHLEECDSCRSVFAAMQEVDAMLPELPATQNANPSPSVEPTGDGGTAEWFVAIDDQQPGPMTPGALEELWARGALDEESLVWRQDMSDWQPLADVPELAHIWGEEVAGRPRSGFLGSNAERPVAEPVTYRTASAELVPKAWKPASEALAALKAPGLDFLVGDAGAVEPDATKEPREAEIPVGLPRNLGSELDPLERSPGGPFEPRPEEWKLPAPLPPREPALKPVHWLLAAVGSSGVLAMAAAVVVLIAYGPVVQSQVAPLPPLPPRDATATQPAAPPSEPQTPGGPATAPARVAVTSNDDTSDRALSRGSRYAGPHSGVKSRAPAGDSARGQPWGRAEPQGVGGSTAVTVPRPTATEITAQMVIAGVKQGSGTLGPCLRTAQAKREIVPGKHTLILQWKIEPNGTVTDPRLVGPANLMGTSLPACFSNAMRKWQFPATPKGAPVRNYPLGPISVTSQ